MGRQFCLSSQGARRGHADEQFSTESCLHGSSPSFRSTVKNIWLLGQDAGMEKKKKTSADVKSESMNWTFKHAPTKVERRMG